METEREIEKVLYHIEEHLDNATRANSLDEAMSDILMALGMIMKARQKEQGKTRKDD